MERFNAACKFCGQFVNLEFELQKYRAEERAMLMCDCPEAKSHQKSYEDRASAALRREDILRRSAKVIDKKFGDEIPEGDEDTEELHAMPLVVVNYLKETCILVYDKQIGSVTLSLPYGCKAKVSRNSKDGLTIERKDVTASKEDV